MKSSPYTNVLILSAMVYLMFMVFSCASQSTNSPNVVGLIIDMDLPASPTEDQIAEAKSDFIQINNVLSVEPRYYNYTTALVQDASLPGRLFFAQMGLGPAIELAISGKTSNEKLSAMSYGDQKAILERSKKILEAAKVCGTNVIVVKGFIPQSFDQNEDTYKALDEMGIAYDMGFQAGILYAPGHENDVWPYKVENHKFYAVPVSTVTLSGEKIPLDDRYIKDKGISASQWYDMLTGKLDEISGKDEPMIVSLSTSISGKGDYLDAFKRFIAYAETNRARFVKTQDLLAIKGLETSTTASECEACKSAKNITYQNLTVIV